MRTSEIVRRLRASFASRFGGADEVVLVRAPGRVNLIGDHTDYNEGFVLPTTLDRAVYTAVRTRRDRTVVLYASHFDEEVQYALDDRPATRSGSWESYVTGAVEELRREGRLDHGFEMLVYGDVPLGAGLSSSAALEVSVVYALDVLFDLDLDPVHAVRLCQSVEHRYAGVECGIMDQFVSRLGRSGSAMLLDCRSLAYRHEPLELRRSGHALVIVDSLVSRGLAETKYGERRAECVRAVAAARNAHPGVESLRDVTPQMLEAQRGIMSEAVYKRARHVLDENDRVLRAAEALLDGGYERFGRLMNASHRSLRDLFEVSCAELDTLAAAAQAVEGVLGARMTGGGFGGCTVNLVRADSVVRLTTLLTEAYDNEYGRKPAFYVLDQSYETEVL